MKTDDIKDALKVQEAPGAKDGPCEQDVRRKYEELTRLLIEKGISITTMESCTSGQVASLITDTEGASAIFRGAFIVYSNVAKIMQGVPAAVIEEFGVYSAQTACCMAQACRTAYAADIGIGVTGSFANADPGNADSVPGEVWFALAYAGDTTCFHLSIPFRPSRPAYKMYAADVIADRVKDLIIKQ